MNYLFLVPISLTLAVIALIAFLWALKTEQYEDLDGAAVRILIDDDTPLAPPEEPLESALDNRLNAR